VKVDTFSLQTMAAKLCAPHGFHYAFKGSVNNVLGCTFIHHNGDKKFSVQL